MTSSERNPNRAGDGIVLPRETRGYPLAEPVGSAVACGRHHTMHKLVRVLTPGLLIFGMGVLNAQSTLKSWTGASGQAFFGRSVAALGDVDNDGVSDIVVGDVFGAGFVGSAHVYSGKSSAPLFTVRGQVPGENFGAAVVGCGDVNGDGVPDFAVGSPLNSVAGSSAGQVVVCSGTNGDILATLAGAAPDSYFGAALANLGDLDGDGIAELAVGAPRQGDNQSGAVWVYRAGGIGGVTLFDGVLGSGKDDALGTAVAAAGDVNGDGVLDFIVGAPQTANASGYIRVHSGTGGTLLWKSSGDNDGDAYGSSVAGVPDVDGDGLADVIVGIPGLDAGAFDAGGLVVYCGVSGVLYQLFVGDDVACRLGFSVAGLEDQDGDGWGEVAAGTDKLEGGEARVWSGASGLLMTTIAAFSATAAGLGSGVVVVATDDMNGDGWNDLLVGVPTRLVAPDPGHVQAVSLQAIIPWIDLGFGLAGSSGVPHLDGKGSLEAGSSFVLTVSNGLPFAKATLVMGLSQKNASFKGGVLVPSPDILSPDITLDVTGSLAFVDSLPTGEVAAGTQVLYQVWIEDSSAEQGLAGSNALAATIP
ncbi:MAG: hypothetical protein ACI9EF_002630 [Pseudohongiellaceae bacterium]|jgi:hypothetical protein